MNDARVQQAASAIAARFSNRPRVGLILGTGLGNLVTEMHVRVEVPYGQIPHFPRSTAMAHKGHLLCGDIRGVSAVIMAGRCHLYEGCPLADLMLPVRVLHALGIEALIVTNAAGGLNPRFDVGDVMVLEDHINLMFAGNCQAASLKRRSLYDTALIESATSIARRCNVPLQRGVYVGVKGPNYETRAEYRAFRRLGGDVVGMSTIPEVLCAAELELRVLALSTVTNIARPDAPQIVTPAEVVAMAGRAEPTLRRLVADLIAGLA